MGYIVRLKTYKGKPVDKETELWCCDCGSLDFLIHATKRIQCSACGEEQVDAQDLMPEPPDSFLNLDYL